jgi:hypothetical protein
MLTNNGRDFLTSQIIGGAYGSIVGASTSLLAIYIALTTDNTAPSLLSTTLTGEITTNGLGRTAGTISTRNAGASSYALSKTFTYTGSSATVINKIGVFTSGTVGQGVLVFETAVASAATVSANGDTLTITQNVSLP